MDKKNKLTGYPSIDRPWLKYYREDIFKLPLPETTIYHYIWEKNKDCLEDLSIQYMGVDISYKELFHNIDKTAAAFAALGVKQGDVVVVALPNTPENIYCIYALNKLGAIADMVDLRSKGDVLVHYLGEADAKIAVVCDLFIDNVMQAVKETNVKKVVVASLQESLAVQQKFVDKMKLPECALLWKQFMEMGELFEVTAVGKSEDTACIFHTSGTTGVPKGVMLSNRSFNMMALQIAESGLRFDYGKVIMNQVPPFLAYNCMCSMHLPFSQHMQMILLPQYQPEKFAENIIRTKASCCVAGPADWGNFLENKELMGKAVDLSGLVSAISGSDAMPLKTKDAVNALLNEKGSEARVLEGYGMTEIGSAACANMPQFNVDASVGIPLPFNNFCIYDNETDSELPYGESGEICMTGPTLMQGYYKNEVETNNVLKIHEDGLTWLHSGDLGHMDENGSVYIEGRLKRIIVRYDGIKISPFMIEKIIMAHSNVVACCVVGSFDKQHGRGQTPAAFIVFNNGSSDSVDSIRKYCENEIGVDYLPSVYKAIESLPLTENGKVDYLRLEKMANEQN